MSRHQRRSTKPVFFDASGRRQRLLRLSAVAVGVVVLGYLALVLVTAIGAPLLPSGRLPLTGDIGRPVDAVPTLGEPARPANIPETTTTTPATAPRTVPEPSRQDVLPARAPSPVTTTAMPEAGAPETTVTTTHPGRRPTDPPGRGQPPTTPSRQGG